MKMYYYYGVMGSSKSANALMARFNFEERGKRVALLKPGIDTRDGAGLVVSRIGIKARATLIEEGQPIGEVLAGLGPLDIVIVDEAQFLNTAQIDELRALADGGVLVMCYGLKTDYMGHLFEGSKRLLEVADTIRELKTMCKCGRKAVMTARYSGNRILYDGQQIDIGGNDKYIALCHRCWAKGTIG